MIKAGRSVEFRGTWRNAMEKFIHGIQKTGHLASIKLKNSHISQLEEVSNELSSNIII